MTSADRPRLACPECGGTKHVVTDVSRAGSNFSAATLMLRVSYRCESKPHPVHALKEILTNGGATLTASPFSACGHEWAVAW